MNDDEWQSQRERAIWAAIKSGRPVFADTEGELYYVDGAREPLGPEAGVTAREIPAPLRISWWKRVRSWLGGRR